MTNLSSQLCSSGRPGAAESANVTRPGPAAAAGLRQAPLTLLYEAFHGASRESPNRISRPCVQEPAWAAKRRRDERVHEF